MFRYFLMFAVLAAPCFASVAESREPWFRGFFRGQRSHRVPRTAPYQTAPHQAVPHQSAQSEPTLFGMGIGIGSYPPYNYPRPGEFNPYRFDSYVYDPYVSGSFEPPDLLNDPYFRERHRYDSHFPGRRHRNGRRSR